MIVLIFDRSKQIVDRLINLIRESNDEGILFCQADSYEQGIEAMKEFFTDAVILDLNFQGINTIELVYTIKMQSPATSVLVTFGMADEQSLQQCSKAGADFLFDKYNDFEKIPAVISAINTRKSFDKKINRANNQYIVKNGRSKKRYSCLCIFLFYSCQVWY
jgi:DNA-binding NarL/FixJ family response regulator